MNNKKVTYLLIIIVACVWGAILFRLFNFLNKDERQNVQINIHSGSIESVTNYDSVALIANYPDPFFSNHPRELKNSFLSKNIKEKIEKTAITIPENRRVEWPPIIYSGIIIHKGTNKAVGMATINNQDFIVWQDSTYMGIHINKLFSDSISVMYKKERAIIKKKFN
jgi:hypothetical protein